MATIYIAVVALTVVAPLIINFCFLGFFYQHEKEEVMVETFSLVNDESTEDEDSYEDETFLDELEKVRATHNLSVVVLDSSGKVLLATVRDTADLNSQLYYAMFGQVIDEGYTRQTEDNYVIQQQLDHRLGEEYLVLWGTLDNGNMIMIRSAVEGIRESTNLTNRFLIYVGILALILSVGASAILSRRITRPIKQLTDISKKMTQLDFDAEYVSQKKRNEVDVLGEHMNRLSKTLEQTIIELKQANHDLKADIALKEENQKNQREFVANVSHELKTPIALIQGYAEGLAEGVNDDEESRKYYCDVIVDEAKRMNRMVMSMISLNQIESGNSEIEYEHFDITALIEGIAGSMQILMQQNDITFTFAHEGPLYVYADEYSIEQVLNNYLSNAIHHAKNEKKIDVKLTPLDKGVRVSIFNTGDPIPEESMAHIWDKFYKVDKARTREYGGTGIGLSIVKAVMENLGQKYGCYNHENGVEFWFEVEC